MFGGDAITFGKMGPTEMLTVGKDSSWTELSNPPGTSLLKYAATVNNEVFMHGKY